MTEYWVSQAKYHCKICNCYMADNRASRLHHETSMGHKIKTEQYMKQKKMEKLHGARNELELKKTLEQVERAARAAMNQPSDGDIHYKTGSLSAPPPPSQYRQYGTKQTENHTFAQPHINESAGLNGTTIIEEDSPGFYTIRGVTYLEGNKFEDKLRNGVNCEVFIEELDEWMGVDQLIRKEIDIPNTTAKFLRFNIRYLINNEDGSYSQKSIEGVKSDQLRIIATEEEAQQLIQKEENVAKENEITELKSNNAGVVGGWQTVSVRTVDEAKEREESEKAAEAMRRREYDDEMEEIDQGPKQIQTAKEFLFSSEPVMYKGIVIKDDEISSTALSNIDRDSAGPVQFVKRRKLNTANLRNAATGKSTQNPITVVIVPTVTSSLDAMESKEDDNVIVPPKGGESEKSVAATAAAAETASVITTSQPNIKEEPVKVSFKIIKPTKNFRAKH